MKTKLPALIILIIIYFLLKYYIPYWNYAIYPINLLVTFLHEFWHAFWAIITWWDVSSVQINSDWSWVTTTSWWYRSIVLMGWYIWSAIFGNVLLYFWSKKDNISEIIIYILSWLMLFTGVFWFTSVYSTIILFLIAWWLILSAKYTKYDWIILQFLWITSLLFIIEDFRVWPSSDLSKFSDIFVLLPQTFWMYIWLIIVIVITGLNIKLILKRGK